MAARRLLKVGLALGLGLGLTACDDAPASGADAAGGAGGLGGAGGVGGADDLGPGGAGAEGGQGGQGGGLDQGLPDMELPPIDWVTPAAIAAPVEGVPPADPACRASWVGAFRGWVADHTGRPAEGAKAQACIVTQPGNTLVCLRPNDADADGVFTITVPETAACMSAVAMRVLRPGTGQATIYCDAPPSGADASRVVRTETPYVVYATDKATVPSIGDATATYTARYADGLEVDLVPDRMYPTSGTVAEARGRAVDPTDRGLCFVDRAQPPDGLWAFWPEAAVDGVGFPVRIPNTGNLAAGVQVDLFVLGGLECNLDDGTHVPEGVWSQYGTGTVRADGAVIESDAGSGLPCFTWFGYRARP